MKNLFFVLFLFLSVTMIYPQGLPSFRYGTYRNEVYYKDIDPDLASRMFFEFQFTFSEGDRITGVKHANQTYWYDDADEELALPFTGNYSVIEDHGLDYLQIFWDDGDQDKYLILGFIKDGYFSFFSLYNDNNNRPFFGNGSAYDGDDEIGIPNHFRPEYISATSELQEGSVVFSTDNLDSRLDICWAASHNGIGERIIIRDTGSDAVFISSGFVSYMRPHLYRQNSRPKTLRVSFAGQAPYIVELEDTYHIQLIIGDRYAYQEHSWKDVWIEVLDVFPGNRFNDLCINFFSFLSGK